MISLLGLLGLLLVGGFIASQVRCAGPFPRDDAHAFEIAHTTLPADATQIQYEGSQGIDWLLLLEFQQPSMERSRAWVEAELGCSPDAVDLRFGDGGGSPEWWGDPRPGGIGCTVREPPGFDLRVRIDALESGQSRVQISVVD